MRKLSDGEIQKMNVSMALLQRILLDQTKSPYLNVIITKENVELMFYNTIRLLQEMKSTYVIATIIYNANIYDDLFRFCGKDFDDALCALRLELSANFKDFLDNVASEEWKEKHRKNLAHLEHPIMSNETDKAEDFLNRVEKLLDKTTKDFYEKIEKKMFEEASGEKIDDTPKQSDLPPADKKDIDDFLDGIFRKE